MAKINVIKPFKLNIDGAILDYAVGVHDVEQEIAGHWYVQAHVGEIPSDAPVVDDPEQVTETPPARHKKSATE